MSPGQSQPVYVTKNGVFVPITAHFHTHNMFCSRPWWWGLSDSSQHSLFAEPDGPWPSNLTGGSSKNILNWNETWKSRGNFFLFCRRSQINTQKLNINYKCSVNSSGLLLTSSYNLIRSYSSVYCQRLVAFTAIPFCMSNLFSIWLTTSGSAFLPHSSVLSVSGSFALLLPAQLLANQLFINNENNIYIQGTKRLFHSRKARIPLWTVEN